MRRSLGLDVLAYPRCGGRLTLIALIEDPAVIARVRWYLGQPTDMPQAQPRTQNRNSRLILMTSARLRSAENRSGRRGSVSRSSL